MTAIHSRLMAPNATIISISPMLKPTKTDRDAFSICNQW
jgi:hypothetical protein